PIHKVENKVILITGTRKGIGKYLVEYYTRKGLEVIGCSRNQVDYQFENYQHFCLDVCDEVKVRGLFTEIRKRYKGVDVLINNAGSASMNHILLT
ncbi:MAG: SDR family NAD(P)-dependent oxidoreductase, partial [Candidatus Aenigmarchaeota archaeon]|nr:SDR family NAD(P)-dependent oxidoreductase [Candidatus Aenigmarchaeota archaeon]